MKKSYYIKTYALGILIAISALLFPQESNGQTPPIIWQKVLGGTSTDFPGVASESKVVKQTSDGGYLVGGYSSSGVNGDKTAPNKGGDDYWVIKLNGAGNKVWDRTYGGTNRDVMTSLTESPGGGFLLAGYSFSTASGDKSQNPFGGADYWIVKIDDNGNKEWDQTIGGTSSEQHVNVIATNDGGYLLTGMSASGIGGSKSEVSRGGWDYWVIKLTATGTIQWDRTYGGPSSDLFPVAVQSPDGGYLISGHSSSPAGQDKSQNSFGFDDYWLVKISSTGAKEWDRTYGGSSNDQFPDVAVTSDGGYLIVGDSPSGISGSKTNVKGGWDFWMIKVNAAGALVWDKSIGGNRDERRPRLDRVAANEFIISGLSQSSQNQDKTDINFGSWDYWVVNIDGNANINWDKTLGASNADYARGVVPAHGGGYVVHGMSFTGAIGSGNKNETGRGGWDYWVVQLDGSGCAGETVPPTITCPADLAVTADASCEGTVPDLTAGATVSDNCSVEAAITVTQSPAVGTVIGVGTTIVTLTATDEAGNTATCTVDVTVEDDSAPQAICQDITIQLDAAGNASITAADIDNGSTDNCGITSLSLDRTTFTCADVGVHMVTLTATDAAGLTSSCQANVTVEDNVAPVAVCQDITIQLQDGTANIQPQDVDGGSSDACGIGNLSLDNSSFTCANVGINVVSLIVTDQNGNVSTCSATVTVEDNEPPVIVEPDDITVLTDAGECGHTFTTALEPIVTDDCGVATITGIRSDGLGLNDPFPVGETTIDWSATDVNGNVSAGESISFMDQVISSAGQFSGNETLIDFQGLPIGGLDPAHFAAQGVELELVNGARAIVVRDLSGPPDSRILANSAIDDLVMTFPGGVNRVGFDVNTNPGDDVTIIIKANGQVIGSQFFNTNRNFQFVGLESSQPFDELILDVTETVNGNFGLDNLRFEGAGSGQFVSQVITVEDSEAPTAVCQDLTIELDAAGNASITPQDVDAGSTDNCGIASISLDNTVFTCADVGPNTVTLTVTDIHGNSSTCTATVTVEDTDAPTINKPLDQLVPVSDPGVCGAVVDFGVTADDNCGIASLDISPASGTVFDVGTTTVTITATDVNGNLTTDSFTVTVFDSEAPTAVCQDLTIELDAAGNASITPQDIDAGSSDNCGIASISVDNTDFTCADVGANTVTLTVTDIYGNSSTCTASVTVEDMIAPSINKPADQLIPVSDPGVCGAVVDFDVTADDNCGIASLDISPTSGTVFDVGTTTVTITATDVNGNVTTDSFTMTVFDSEAPTAVCQDLTIQLDAAGNASITPQDVDAGSTDNCGIASISVDITDFTCADVGPNAVTLTLTDIHGNSSTCTATVTVEDMIAPSINKPADQLIPVSDPGVCGAVVDFDVTADDNCGIASLDISPASGTVFDVGTTTVTITATDVNGNLTTDSFTVTVFDSEAPTAVCQDLTIELDAAGSASITPQDVDAGSTDNCGIASISLDNTDFTCADVGANTVTLTVIDIHGNSSTCTATVTVEDTAAPTINKPLDQLVPVSDPGVCGATVDFIVTADDNCSIASLDISPASGSVFDVGTTTVTITATDVNGNLTTDSFTVTVFDSEAPTAVCQDLTIELDAAGSASITPQDVDAGSTDNCGIASISLDNTDFTCADVGANAVTLTVTDIHGNSSTCTATVTVEDTAAPTISKPLDQLVPVTDPGVCGATVDFLVTANDNCGIASLDISPSSGTVFDVGTTTVNITATDFNGNVTTDSFTVTVIDSEAPMAVCQDLTIELDAAGSASITLQDVDGGSTDNCGIASISLDKTDFSCADVGANTVTLTVVDIYGNSSSCTSTVTVEDNTPPVVECQDITVVLDENGTAFVPAEDLTARTNLTSDNWLGFIGIILNGNFSGGDVVAIEDIKSNVDAENDMITLQPNFDPSYPENFDNPELQGSTYIETYGDLAGKAFEFTGHVVSNSLAGQYNGFAFIRLFDANFGFLGEISSPLVAGDDFSVAYDNSMPDAWIIQYGFTVQGPSGAFEDEASLGEAVVQGMRLRLPPYDNCTIASIESTQTEFDCSHAGENIVTLTVTDVNGNATSCDATVTIVDKTPPVAVCQDITIQLDASGNAFITPDDIDNGSSDACGIDFIELDRDAFGCNNVGQNQVTLTVTDIFGNSSSCTAIVTVEDVTAPELIAPDPLVLTGSGLDCGASLILPTPEVIESCGLSSAELLANGETLFDYTFVPADGTLEQPRQLIFGPDGNLYVGDLTFGPNGQEGRIMKFDGTTGATLLEIGGPSGSTSLAYPRGLDFGPDGNLYVSSSSSGEVLRFDPNTGALIDTFVPAGTGGLTAPTGLVFGPDGDLYVVDRVGSVVRKYDATTGAYLGDFVAPGAGGMVFPIGLTFGPDGNLYVASFFTNAVHRFDGTTGAFIDQFVPSGSGGLQGPEDVEFGPDGDLYVTSFSTGQLFKYDGSTGAFLQDITATGIGLFFPDGLIFGPDGHLYASNTGGDQIVRYPLGELDLPYGVNDITFNVADQSGNPASITYTIEVEDDVPPVFDPVSDLLMPTFEKSDGRIVEYDLPTATDNCDLAGPPTLISGIGSGGFFPIGTTTEVYEVTDINGNVSTTSFVVTVTTDLGIVNFDLVCTDKKDKYANEDKDDYGKHKDKDDKCDGNVIRPLKDGDVIDAADPATSSISIVANVSRKAGSVAFYLDGELVRIDNYKDYSITGNKKDIYEFNPSLGTHTLTAIPYSKKDGEGDEGIPLTITFTVINTSAVTSFNLFETDKDGQTLPMTDGQVIDVAGGYEFTIEAVTDPAEVGSVLFLLNGEKVSIDNDNIYLLENPKKGKDDDDDYGKHKDKDDKREKAKPFDWAAGDYTLTAIPFEDEDMCGTSGTSATITFTIVNSEAVTSFAIVDEKKKKKDEDEVLIPLEDGDIVDIDDLRSKYRAIQAFTNPDEVGSVVFYLDGEEVDTDYKAPYLTDVFEKLKCKDSKKDAAKHKGDKYDLSCILGEHTLTAVPYSQKKGEGVAGTALTITFEVVQSTSTREELDSEELADLQVDAIQSVVYPNPVVDKVSLSILSPMEDGAELAVIDLSGKVLHKQALELRRGNNEVELDLVELNVSVGTVLIKVSTHQQGTMTHRLMKR